MSNRETLDYDPVDALIEQGRRELTDGNIEKARWCFEEVLRRRPDEPRALLGLSYAARKSDMPPSMDEASEAEQKAELADAASVLSVDVEVVVLVREKRYGEALVKLRAELSKRPDDPVLLRSIAHLEQHISRASARPGPSASVESEAAPKQESQPSIPKLRPVTMDAPPAADAEAKPEAATKAKTVEKTEPESAEVPAPVTVNAPPPSPLASASPAESESTVPFELVKVAPPPKGDENVSEALLKPAPESEARLESSEARMDDFTSSGGFPLADEEPSVPALGSLPAEPAPAANKGSGATWWIFALLAVAALALALALR
ncbi:MAG: hypothetical protein AB8H86_01430 [Polyangiales bacterium]